MAFQRLVMLTHHRPLLSRLLVGIYGTTVGGTAVTSSDMTRAGGQTTLFAR
jgi:hypothetical protein